MYLVEPTTPVQRGTTVQLDQLQGIPGTLTELQLVRCDPTSLYNDEEIWQLCVESQIDFSFKKGKWHLFIFPLLRRIDI